MRAGGWDVTLLEVGSLPLKAENLGPEGAFDGPVTVPSNALLLRRDGATVLVDAGAGPLHRLWPGSVGDLDAALAAAGSSAEVVDTLVLTHLDFDHCGGAVTDVASTAFIRATAVVPREAADAARDAEHDDWNPGRPVVEAYGEAGTLVEAGAGDVVAPDVVMRAAPGHRVGHSVLEIGDELVFLADVVHHPLHVEHPDWDRGFDSDPEQALATRREVLAAVAASGATVAASHIAGLGRIVAGGSGLRWQPL
jgi:glyoxylase-like metal-dependent hydrolase (beta-lactamase superfamily II)